MNDQVTIVIVNTALVGLLDEAAGGHIILHSVDSPGGLTHVVIKSLAFYWTLLVAVVSHISLADLHHVRNGHVLIVDIIIIIIFIIIIIIITS